MEATMKKIIITSLFIVCCTFLYSQTNSFVINLIKNDFKTKVFDYENNNQWTYKGSMPCIIDFYADWCRPCKEVAPILEELAKKYYGKIIVYKVNADKERELSKALGIESIPTFFFVPVKGDLIVARGALSKEYFEKVINQILLK